MLIFILIHNICYNTVKKKILIVFHEFLVILIYLAV